MARNVRFGKRRGKTHGRSVRLHRDLTVKEGKLGEAKTRLRRLVEVVEENEPRLIAFNVYSDEAGTTVAVLQGPSRPGVDGDAHEGHLRTSRRRL